MLSKTITFQLVMFRFLLLNLLVFCFFNLGASNLISAEPSDTKKRTESKRKEKKKNREGREAKKDETVSLQKVEGLAP